MPNQPSNDHLSLKLINNVVWGKQYREALISAATEIGEILKAHCGPFATDAVIPTRISRDDPTAVVDRYTKDGISIAKLLTSRDLMTNYLLRLVVHVGERVDNACHDGTTTSMLLFLQLLMYGGEAVQKGVSANDTLPQWKDAVTATIDHAREFIQTSALTISDLVTYCQDNGRDVNVGDVRYALAYHEALLSSKGDIELADGIAQVIASLPDEMFGYYTIDNTPYETEHRYVTKLRDYDIQMGGNIKPVFFNHKLNTELLLEQCDLMITEADPSIGSPITSALCAMMLADQEFHAYIKEELPILLDRLEAAGAMPPLDLIPPTDEAYIQAPLLVLAPTWITCPHVDAMITQWNKRNPDRKIMDVQIQPDAILRQSYASAISAVAGKVPVEQIDPLSDNFHASIIRGAKVRASTRTVQLFNLYHKTGDLFHPFYMDKAKNPFYTQTLDTIRELITEDKNAHVTGFTDVQQKSLIAIYRMMTCQRIVDLQTGGSTHTAVSARDVVTDAYGSALSAVEHGVVLGGYPKLMQWMIAHSNSDTLDSKMAVAWASALTDLAQVIYRVDSEVCFPQTVAPLNYTLPDGKGGVMNRTLHESLEDFLCPAETRHLKDSKRLSILKEKDRRILFQPVVGYNELFRLLDGILPNLLSSDKFISVGG